MRWVRMVMVAAAVLGGAAAAQAQNNPTADEIIRSLQPTRTSGHVTRGIRPLTSDAPTAAPEVAPVPEGADRPMLLGRTKTGQDTPPPAAETAPSVSLSIEFATNSAELTPAAVTTLMALGQALSSDKLASYRFRIEGHTDTAGAAEANKALSERRARAVVAFLASRFRIDSSRLDPVGMGEDGLLVPTPPNTAESRNRRVQITNLGT